MCLLDMLVNKKLCTHFIKAAGLQMSQMLKKMGIKHHKALI